MSDDLDLEPEDSPCKLVCSMEKKSGLCFGCGRTSDEIAQWTLLSESKRKQILSELPARMPPLDILREERRKLRRVNRRRSNNKS